MYSLSKFFGTDPKDPWVVFREDDDDDIVESETIINSPQAHTAIVGGHSPGSPEIEGDEQDPG